MLGESAVITEKEMGVITGAITEERAEGDPPVVSRHPSSSIHFLCNGPEKQQQDLDSDVQMAVEALGDLKNQRRMSNCVALYIEQ